MLEKEKNECIESPERCAWYFSVSSSEPCWQSKIGNMCKKKDKFFSPRLGRGKSPSTQHREVYQLLCEWLLEHMNSRLATIEWPCDIGYDAYVVVTKFNTRFVCNGTEIIMINPPIKKVFPFEIRQCSNIIPEVLLNIVLDYM